MKLKWNGEKNISFKWDYIIEDTHAHTERDPRKTLSFNTLRNGISSIFPFIFFPFLCVIVWWIINCACCYLAVSVAAMSLSHLICNNAIYICVSIKLNKKTEHPSNSEYTLFWTWCFSIVCILCCISLRSTHIKLIWPEETFASFNFQLLVLSQRALSFTLSLPPY